MENLNGTLSAPSTTGVIFDKERIYNTISSELQKAKQTIYVAVAWFTDQELLDILIAKARTGVNIEVIIADNVSNEKLDFSPLESSGGKVIKIKNTGYGMMHHKFCVIDRRLALHGSYNWTVNAKKNNDESIYISSEKEDIEEYIKKFNDIKLNHSNINKNHTKKDVIKNLINKFLPQKEKEIEPQFQTNSNSAEERENVGIEKPANYKLDFESILDQMIAAEVSNFDRDLLRNEGYERSKTNNGDHQVLSNALDSVYSIFINEINTVLNKFF